MAKKTNKSEFDRNVEDQARAYKELINLQKMEYEGLSHIFSLESKRTKMMLDLLSAQKEQDTRKQEYLKLSQEAAKGENDVSRKTLTAIEKELKAHQKIVNTLNQRVKVMNAMSKINFKNLGDFANELGKLNMFTDKPIRDTVLQLGYGAEKAQLVRDAFYEALPNARILGATMQNLAEIQTSYADESGRALALSGKQLENITEISKGTGLATNEAGKLVAQFELLGMDTQRSHETIQGIVDSSERMGVSTNKVLKAIAINFKALNTFAFKDGIKGMAKMAQYSEKFKISMEETINSAGKARTLEGAIEMASQLQILGGQFTKADPFELFHLSRNDPAKYTQKLNEMVRGMSTLVKTADGFKLQTSPQDLDRLKLAAEATGQEFSSLVQQSERMGEIMAMNKQLMGTAFSPDDREAIQSMAKLDSKSGIYKVLGKDISKLSAQEVESLKTQQKTLKERSEAAQTFDEKFKNTIDSMKYTLLPILDGINSVFDTLHPLMKSMSTMMQSLPEWSKTGLRWTGIAVGLVTAGGMLKSVAAGLPLIGKIFGKGSKVGSAASSTLGGGVASASGGGGGMAALGKGAGVGLTAAGIGAGIGLAAIGISKMATAFKELDPKQLDSINDALKTMGIIFGGTLAAGLLAVSFAGPAATVPLLALGAAAAGIGIGIGAAAAGIGYMAKGFNELLTEASPEKVFKLALSIGALGSAMTGLATGSVLALFTGGGAFAMLGLLSTRANAFERIGKSMKDIAVVLNADGEGLSRLKETLDSISNTKSNGGIFSEIKDMMKNGLKVEFKDKNIAMNVDVSLNVDSDVLARAVAKKIVVLHKGYQEGKKG